MKEYPLEIVTPRGIAFEESVEAVSVRGIEGSLAIYANHTPFVTSLAKGEIRIYKNGEQLYKEGSASGGILSVTKEKTTILAADFNWKE